MMDEWLLLSNLKILQNFTVLCVPLFLSSLGTALNKTITIFFVSQRNDPILLAGIGLGSATNDILCYIFLYSMSTALMPFASIAYGLNDLHQCGVYLNKSRAILTFFFILFVILLSFSDRILIVMR